MKKAGSLVLALMLCLCLCACGNQEEIQNYQNLLEEKDMILADAENELMNQEQTINHQMEVIAQQEQQISEYEEKLAAYGWLISGMENGSYDSLISQLEQKKEEARKAELEARGVVEIVITADNWDQYFEYVPHGYAYIRNAFNEITHMNMLGGLRLKSEHNMAEDAGTVVNFEMETYMETRSCSVDFTEGTFEYGDIIKAGTRYETTTTRFGDSYLGKTLGFGSIYQVNNEKGNQITKEVTIEAVSRMIRAEGVLYLYKS